MWCVVHQWWIIWKPAGNLRKPAAEVSNRFTNFLLIYIFFFQFFLTDHMVDTYGSFQADYGCSMIYETYISIKCFHLILFWSETWVEQPWIRQLWIYTRLCRYRKNFREELQHEQWAVLRLYNRSRFCWSQICQSIHLSQESLTKKIVLPNKKWQLLSSSFGHLQHTIYTIPCSGAIRPSFIMR